MAVLLDVTVLTQDQTDVPNWLGCHHMWLHMIAALALVLETDPVVIGVVRHLHHALTDPSSSQAK